MQNSHRQWSGTRIATSAVRIDLIIRLCSILSNYRICVVCLFIISANESKRSQDNSNHDDDNNNNDNGDAAAVVVDDDYCNDDEEDGEEGGGTGR